ncbi:hypothetical protein ACU6QD_06995 [Corynebacterium glucuronolyticum]
MLESDLLALKIFVNTAGPAGSELFKTSVANETHIKQLRMDLSDSRERRLTVVEFFQLLSQWQEELLELVL